MSNAKDSRNVATVKEYYARGDAGRTDLFDLFSDDLKFYFPKFGIGAGKATFAEFITGFMTAVKSISHDVAAMRIIEAGGIVVVEGVTNGTYYDDRSWSGGKTSGGRFCSVFEFNGEGLINRMHVYLDPDYMGDDARRFLWGESRCW